jgi:hypothetical protein
MKWQALVHAEGWKDIGSLFIAIGLALLALWLLFNTPTSVSADRGSAMFVPDKQSEVPLDIRATSTASRCFVGAYAYQAPQWVIIIRSRMLP